MIIPINDDVRISYSESNYQLEKRRVVQEGKRAGEEVWSSFGYYSTLHSAAKGLLMRHLHMLLPEDIKDLQTLAMVIEEVADGITRACKQAVQEQAAVVKEEEKKVA